MGLTSPAGEHLGQFFVWTQAPHVDHLPPVGPLPVQVSVLVLELVERLVELVEEQVVDGVDLAGAPRDRDDSAWHGLGGHDHEVGCSATSVADEGPELDADVLYSVRADGQL